MGRMLKRLQSSSSARAAGLAVSLAWAPITIAAQAVSAQQAAPASQPVAQPKVVKKVANPEAAPKRDPAAAQSAVDAAAKLLDGGKVDQAVTTLSGAISGGNLPPTLMPRALYMRGMAYRRQSKPALAISDLTSALWLKGGLSDIDRTDATQQRAAAYSEAGLTDQGQVPATSTASRKRAETVAEGAAPAAATSTGGLFAGLFGGSTAAAPPPKEGPAPRSATVPAATEQLPWQTPGRQTVTVAAPPATARIATATIAAARPAAATTPTGSGSHFQSRVALVRTKAEAEAIVAKLKVQYAGVLADRAPDIGQTAFGNMGTFFQVRVGPFATAAEAQSLCGRLNGSGLDCVAVDH